MGFARSPPLALLVIMSAHLLAAQQNFSVVENSGVGKIVGQLHLSSTATDFR